MLKTVLVTLLLGFAGIPVWALPPNISIVRSFTGATYGLDTLDMPPDSEGYIGPNHYVELINGRLSIYNKLNGARVKTSTDEAFWTAGGVSFTSNLGITDPRMVYDVESGHWFASQIDFDPNTQTANRFLLAVSRTSDPTASWAAFAFQADPSHGNFADFPTLGVNHDCVILSANMFSPGTSGTPVGTALVSVPKADLISTTPTVTNRHFYGILTQGTHGANTQPVVNLSAGSSDTYCVGVPDVLTGNHLLLWHVINGNGAGPSPSLSSPVSLNIGSYSFPINPPQPDGSSNLDDGDARLSSMFYELNGNIYGVHNVQPGARAELEYFRISATSGQVMETGILSDTALDLFYPSIAVNNQGVVVLTYNGCSSNSFVSAYATAGQVVNGHLHFGTPVKIASGTASYNDPGADGTSRWGDYSAVSVDPEDPTSFWTVQEIPSGVTTYQTKIIQLRVVVPAPKIETAVASGMLELLWPTNADNFNAQTSITVGTNSVWTPLATSPSVQGTNFQLSVPLGQGNQFFRLSQ